MVNSINPSNSHVLNTLVFNAGQLRRIYSDVTELPVSSFVSLPFNKASLIEAELDSMSVVSSVSSVKFKPSNSTIQASSSVNIPVVHVKFTSSSIIVHVS